LVGLGWDARATDGADFDLDASAFLLAEMIKFVVNMILFFITKPVHQKVL
jgi:stress response protein SCP2